MSARSRVLVAVVLASLIVSGCARGCTSSRPPIHINPSMDDQPKARPQAASAFFYNGASMREPIPGTIAIGELQEDGPFFTGRGAGGLYVAAIPTPVNDEVVERGRQRYGIYCQPCHDARGEGRGILFQRGNVPTGNFHEDKILNYPDGQIFDVITNGVGLMSGYRWPIPTEDRWAIVAYVRELQRERLARAAAVSDAAAPAVAQAPAPAEASASPGATADQPADQPTGVN